MDTTIPQNIRVDELVFERTKTMHLRPVPVVVILGRLFG
jgi:hypothetical protein